GDRRVNLFWRACQAAGTAAPTLLPWIDVLRAPTRLEEARRADTLLRIESTGDDFPVWRELVALGAEARGRESTAAVPPEVARSLPLERGRVRYLRQWYLGWERVLQGLEDVLARTGVRRVMNGPAAIRRCGDKA